MLSRCVLVGRTRDLSPRLGLGQQLHACWIVLHLLGRFLEEASRTGNLSQLAVCSNRYSVARGHRLRLGGTFEKNS